MRRQVWVLAALLALTFGLRLYRLDAVPLRGDEAFAVRYWAAPPADVIREVIEWEPHPFGTFLGFWAWKNAAGDSVFAMRYLPLLGNWIGAAAIAALARRLFADHRVAVLGVLLWAINPLLIWHAQDVRNYALWAGLSPLALWSFLRATDHNRRRDWALYVLIQLLALHAFFLEAFFLVAQGAYLFVWRRSAAVLRRAAIAWGLLAILLVPWVVQIWILARSGYQGTTEAFTTGRLMTWVFPALLTGEALHAPWTAVFYLALTVVVLVAVMFRRATSIGLLLFYSALPTLLWLGVGTRMDIFNPRYLIAVVPPLLLIIAAGIVSGQGARQWTALAGGFVIVLLGLHTLTVTYRGDHPKAGDWPALAAYLEKRARPGDLVVQVTADPAFGYYYQGDADETSLEPGVSIPAQLTDDLNFYRTFWLVGRSGEAETYLGEHLQEVSFDASIRGHPVRQYRRWDVAPREIESVTHVMFGDLVRLRGYTLQGPGAGSRAITLLLYWEPLRTSDTDYTVFVHLVGPPRPDTGHTLWDQDDHPPQVGATSTSTWATGVLLRDPYHLLGAPAISLVPDMYTVHVGFYDPATSARLPVFDANGRELGDSYPLIRLGLPRRR